MEEGTSPADGTPVTVDGLEKPGVIHSAGLTLIGNDGKMVSVEL